MSDDPFKSPPESHGREPTDYSHEVNVHHSPWLRYTLVTAGTTAMALGIIGVFLPVLPTTPFILLAAACYARSSVRFYNWLMNNRWFGPLIHRWRTEGTVPLRAKIIAIILLVFTMGTSIYFFIPVLAVQILVGLIGLGVVIYLIRLPTAKPPEKIAEEINKEQFNNEQ